MKRNFAREIISQLDDETRFRYHEALNQSLLDSAALQDAFLKKDRERVMDLVATIPGGRLDDAARQFVSFLEAQDGIFPDAEKEIAFWTRKFQTIMRKHAEREAERLA